MLKSCADIFALIIAHLANLSFEQGRFPTKFKLAQVLPLLKKSRCGPVSTCQLQADFKYLSTIVKLIERLVLRLRPHLLSSGNFNPLQSAYRTGHSTETALLFVLDNIYKSIDSLQLTTVVCLDISAAFDTISHSTLLQRLCEEFVVAGMPSDWLRSYLSNRSYYVKLGSHSSPTVNCTFGVPQGSVLELILFAAYISPLSRVISSHGVGHHQYADDTQLFLAMRASTMQADLLKLEDVKSWFAKNDLLLNADKSEAMMIGTSFQLRSAATFSTVTVANSRLTVSS